MKVRILGTAAGGGAPQWNCACRLCRAGRACGRRRDQDCLAVSATGTSWYLLNASPDLRAQLLAAPGLAPGPGPRETPIRGALLTDAELDHTLGLFLLREAPGLTVWASPAVLAAIGGSLPMRQVLDPYAGWSWRELTPDEKFQLDGGALHVTAIPVGSKRPRYAAGLPADGPWVVAYRIEDPRTGGVLLYAPCLAAWPPGFDEVLAGATCAVIDGTFFSPDEMSGATGESGGQRSMGHLPVSGPDGSLALLARHPGVRRMYTHLNNTNPLLDEAAPERATVAAAGVEIPADGTELEL